MFFISVAINRASKAMMRIGFYALLVTLTACESPQDAEILKPGNADIVTSGKAIYRAHCASCHGVALEGQPNWQMRLANGRLPAPPHDDTGHTWHHADEVLISITRVGPGKHIGDPDYATDMPAYEGVLKDNEIIAVLSYIKSTWSDNVLKANERLNAQ